MTLKEAVDILSSFEYSSDGFVKRYPDEELYEQAVIFLYSKIDTSME